MLRGGKVTLGPIVPNDFQSLFLWDDDIQAARFNEAYRPTVWRNLENFWFNVGQDPSRVFFAIRKAGSETIIGYIQIMEIDAVHRSARLGIRIGNAADRGQGYGRDALLLAIHYCWNHLNLSRISLGVFGGNEPAIRFYEAVGFETEGRQRRALFIDGGWVDLVLMGLLHPSRAAPPQS